MDWRKIWIIARREYRVNVRKAGFIIMTAIVPLMSIIGLAAGTLFSGQARAVGEFFEKQFDMADKRAGVVDRSGYFTPILPEYQEQFIPYADEAQAEAALVAGEIASLLIFEEDYLESGAVTIVTVGSGFGAAAASDSATVKAFFVDHLLAGKVAPALQKRAADPAHIEPRVISSTGKEQGRGGWAFAFNFIIPYILTVFLVMSIFISSGYLLQSVAEEKESRVVEIVVSSVRPMELMAGKVAGLGAIGLTQIVIWIASAVGFSSGAVVLMAAVGAATIPARILILGGIYCLLGYVLYAILMASVGALGATSQESQQLAGIFSFFAAIPYMLSGFLFTNPNMTIARVLSWFPFTAPTMMLLRLPLGEVPWIDVVGSIILLLASIPIALWAGGKLFRVGLLIYGKRPTLKEIWAILREKG